MLSVTPGWPDLEVIVPRDDWSSARPWAPIFIELKTQTGAISKNQSCVIDTLRAAGAYVFVCRSVQEVLAAVGAFVAIDAKAMI